ncbi:MAG: hypothetical protein WCK91_03375 [bacterium]
MGFNSAPGAGKNEGLKEVVVDAGEVKKDMLEDLGAVEDSTYKHAMDYMKRYANEENGLGRFMQIVGQLPLETKKQLRADFGGSWQGMTADRIGSMQEMNDAITAYNDAVAGGAGNYGAKTAEERKVAFAKIKANLIEE